MHCQPRDKAIDENININPIHFLNTLIHFYQALSGKMTYREL